MAIRSALLVVCCVLMASVVQAKISGQFVDKSGQKCKYREDRLNGGKGPRAMVVTCGKAYSCTYKGNPHSCNWYNHNHQPAFYECLTKDLKNASTACSAASIECPKKCGGVVMKKLPAGYDLLRKMLFQVLDSYDELAGDNYDSLDSFDSFDSYY